MEKHRRVRRQAATKDSTAGVSLAAENEVPPLTRSYERVSSNHDFSNESAFLPSLLPKNESSLRSGGYFSPLASGPGLNLSLTLQACDKNRDWSVQRCGETTPKW